MACAFDTIICMFRDDPGVRKGKNMCWHVCAGCPSVSVLDRGYGDTSKDTDVSQPWIHAGPSFWFDDVTAPRCILVLFTGSHYELLRPLCAPPGCYWGQVGSIDNGTAYRSKPVIRGSFLG